MSNDPVRTKVHTEGGVLDFQHYFVREKCQPVVSRFEYAGAATARVNPHVEAWLGSENLAGIILCPSSPFTSIDPILSLPALREALQRCETPVIAISPIVGGDSLKGPQAKIMREISVPITASWVAEQYADFVNGIIIDPVDAGQVGEIEALGMASLCTNIVMTSMDDRVRLAVASLEFIASLSQSDRAKADCGE
jgi:LPPG:FO 2-phospho-L-lactate transferase